MKKKLISLLLWILYYHAFAQLSGGEALVHTYSIVARDQNTGEMAVGVQSHWYSVGTIVSWAESGVGVVATQSFVNPAYGSDGLRLMKSGWSASNALKELIQADQGSAYRQVAMLDVTGNVDAFTGSLCIKYADHHVGKNFAVQANMMLNDAVVPAIASSFENNNNLPLAERVILALKAGQAAGGDIRGRQSAVLLVVNGTVPDHPWMDKKIDLRVDDDPEPLEELERLLKVHRAYEHMNRGDLAIEEGDMERALNEYESAEKMFPDNLEMRYWKAVGLANNGKIEESLPIFKDIFRKDKNWRELTRRLPSSRLLNVSDHDLVRILRQ